MRVSPMRGLDSFVLTTMRRVAVLSIFIIGSGKEAQAQTALPPPTGPYEVGRTVFRWIDTARPEVFSSRPSDNREVAVWLWYPAVHRSGVVPAPYVEDLEALAGVLTPEEISLASSVRTHSAASAEPLSEPRAFPVLLFSPGSASLPALYTSFAEDLASHGYAVAVLDHPYDGAAALLADGRVVGMAAEPDGGDELLAFRKERVRVRVDDMIFTVGQLALLNDGGIESPFQGRLDLERLGALGHSIGGMTAAAACMKDERFRACANMDGVAYAMPAYPDVDDRGPRQPFLFLAKPFATMPGESREDAQSRTAALHERGNSLLDDVQRGRSYRVTIAGATHATFSDEELLGSENAERPRALLSCARAYLLAFVDENVRGQRGALLDTVPPDDVITLETFPAQ